MRLKPSICPHENQDIETDVIRKDSAATQCYFICLMISIITFLPFRIGLVDSKRSLPSKRSNKKWHIYPPPSEWKKLTRGWVWHLQQLSHGISEVSSQLVLVMEQWILNRLEIEIVYGESRLLLSRDNDTNIKISFSESYIIHFICWNVWRKGPFFKTDTRLFLDKKRTCRQTR